MEAELLDAKLRILRYTVKREAIEEAECSNEECFKECKVADIHFARSNRYDERSIYRQHEIECVAANQASAFGDYLPAIILFLEIAVVKDGFSERYLIGRNIMFRMVRCVL